MLRSKWNKTAIVTCIFSVALMISVTTNIWTPSLQTYSYIKHQRLSVSTTTTKTTTPTLFNDKTKDAVLNCITGEVVGMRPRHIDTVDVRQLRLSERSELDQHRKAVFHEIFHRRLWGKNPHVHFSASGRPMISVRFVGGVGGGVSPPLAEDGFGFFPIIFSFF